MICLNEAVHGVRKSNALATIVRLRENEYWTTSLHKADDSRKQLMIKALCVHIYAYGPLPLSINIPIFEKPQMYQTIQSECVQILT